MKPISIFTFILLVIYLVGCARFTNNSEVTPTSTLVRTEVPTNTTTPTSTKVPDLPDDGIVDFNILHINDFHHHLFEANPGVNWVPGAARLSGFINTEREKMGTDQTLVLDAGDWMTMDGEYNRYLGEDAIEIYKLIGVQATVIGNHELDFRAPRLLELLKNSSPLRMLSINFQKTNKEGKCTTTHLADAYEMFFLGSESGPKVRVAVVGVTNTGAEFDMQNAPSKSPVCFSDFTQKIIDLYPTLKKTEKADVVILLTHLGFDVDQQLAQALIDADTPADIIIGGHSHTCMDEPFLVGGTYIVSACEWGQYVGMMDIVYNRSMEKMDVDWKLHKITAADPIDYKIVDYLQLKYPEKVTSTRTPLPEGKYLLSVTPASETVGYWELGRGVFPASDANFSEGQELFSHGNSYPMGLFAHAPSTLVYDLNGGYSKFISDILVQDNACGDGAEFAVQLDGSEIYSSGVLKAVNDPLHISLDISGGKELKLFTLTSGDNSCDWTIWGNPYLVR